MPTNPRYLWLNGEFVQWESATVNLTDVRGRFSPLSIFASLSGYWNADHQQIYLFRMLDHLDRFIYSTKLLRMLPRQDSISLSDIILELVRRNRLQEDFRIWLDSSFGETPGHLLGQIDNRKQEFIIYPTQCPGSLNEPKPLEVCVSSWYRTVDNGMPPPMKTNASCLMGRLAAMQGQIDGFDGALVLDLAGNVSGGPWECVFLVRDGILITPKVASDVLEDISRNTIIQLASRTLNLPVEERDVDRTELYACDEVFLVRADMEIVPITSIDHLVVANESVGPITRELQTFYSNIVQGKEPRFLSWITPVY